MSDECIHGLDNGACAVCFPQAAPEAATLPRTTRAPASRAREASSPTTLRTAKSAATRTVAPARTATVKSPTAPVGEQRIYHLTHISNLHAILDSGRLLSDTSEAWQGAPSVDISSTGNREARRAALVAGPGSRRVADFVPFFLSPVSSMWDGIRSQRADPRLSKDARQAATFDFVVLVSTVATVAGAGENMAPDVAVADGDAAAAATRFGATEEASERMLQKLRADQHSDAMLRAEFLVGEAFPFELVSLIGVANDRVRDTVRDILAESGHRPKVAVYPPWFQSSEDDAQ